MDGGGLFTIGLMVVVFYFLLVRPQMRRAKQQRTLIASIEAKDDVLMTSGIFGTVEKVEGELLFVRVDNNTVLRFAAGAVLRKIVPETQTEGAEQETKEEAKDEPGAEVK